MSILPPQGCAVNGSLCCLRLFPACLAPQPREGPHLQVTRLPCLHNGGLNLHPVSQTLACYQGRALGLSRLQYPIFKPPQPGSRIPTQLLSDLIGFSALPSSSPGCCCVFITLEPSAHLEKSSQPPSSPDVYPHPALHSWPPALQGPPMASRAWPRVPALWVAGAG